MPLNPVDHYLVTVHSIHIPILLYLLERKHLGHVNNFLNKPRTMLRWRIRRPIKAGIMNELSGIKRFRVNKRKAVPRVRLVQEAGSIWSPRFERAIAHTYSDCAQWLVRGVSLSCKGVSFGMQPSRHVEGRWCNERRGCRSWAEVKCCSSTHTNRSAILQPWKCF